MASSSCAKSLQVKLAKSPATLRCFAEPIGPNTDNMIFFFNPVEIKWLVRWCFNQGEDNHKVRMKYSQWRQPVWWQWEILRVSTFILGLILAHWMWLKRNAGLQLLHQQNGDNISTYASHFKWKALHSCKIALSCQYTAEFFTFCLEHFIKIPTYGTEQVLQTVENVIFRELTVPLTFVQFRISNTVMFGNEIQDHLLAFMKRADHTAPGFASPVTTALCTSPGPCPGWGSTRVLPAAAWAAGRGWQVPSKALSFAHGFWSRNRSFSTLNSSHQECAAASIVIPPLVHSGQRRAML